MAVAVVQGGSAALTSRGSGGAYMWVGSDLLAAHCMHEVGVQVVPVLWYQCESCGTGVNLVVPV